jgi:hypothetical protein
MFIPWNMSMRNIMQLSENEAENNERASVEWREAFFTYMGPASV